MVAGTAESTHLHLHIGDREGDSGSNLSLKASKPVQRRTPLIPALRRQRQADLCEFEASLVYRVSSRTASKATEKPCLGTQLPLQKRHCHNPAGP